MINQLLDLRSFTANYRIARSLSTQSWQIILPNSVRWDLCIPLLSARDQSECRQSMTLRVLGDFVFKCRKKSRWYFSIFEISVLDNNMLFRPYSSLGFMHRFYKVTDTSRLRVNAVQTVQSMLRHKAGQEGRGEILLENSFLRWRCYQGKIMHTTSKNFSVLYVLRKHQQHINIQWHHLRCYFWLIDHPILEQVATPRSFQLESILDCPVLDVRQLVRNKRRKEYD